MSNGKMTAAVSFVAKHLKKNPEMTLPQMKDLAAEEGFTIYPVIMAKAREELGITARRGRRRGSGGAAKSGRRAAAPSGRKTSARRSGRKPGRSKAVVAAVTSGDPLGAVQRLASHMADLEREVASLRDVLGKVAKLTASFSS